MIVLCHSFQNSELMDKLTAAETEAAELKNLVDDLEYELGNAKTRVLKLDCRLSDATQKLKTFQEGEITVQGGGEGVSKNKVSVTGAYWGPFECYVMLFFLKKQHPSTPS